MTDCEDDKQPRSGQMRQKANGNITNIINNNNINNFIINDPAKAPQFLGPMNQFTDPQANRV